MTNPAAPENNLHHTTMYRSLAEFYEDLRDDPDYPQTHAEVDFRTLSWFKEWGDQD